MWAYIHFWNSIFQFLIIAARGSSSSSNAHDVGGLAAAGRHLPEDVVHRAGQDAGVALCVVMKWKGVGYVC